MTKTGQNRTDYEAIEPRPSRFANPVAYAEWAERADAWAARRDVAEMLDREDDALLDFLNKEREVK